MFVPGSEPTEIIVTSFPPPFLKPLNIDQYSLSDGSKMKAEEEVGHMLCAGESIIIPVSFNY